MNQQSNYICKCNNLLYVDVTNKKEYCLNKDCEKYGNIKNIRKDYSQAEEQFKKLIGAIKIKSIKFGPSFRKFLFQKENEIVLNLFSKGKLKLSNFLYVPYLLYLIKNISFNGRDNRIDSFNKFIKENYQTFDTYLFFQNIKEENYVLTDTTNKENNPLILKYLESIREQQREYGIIGDNNPDNSFQYEKIGIEKIEEVPFKIGMDLEKYFRNFFRLMIQIDMITKTNYEFSKLFDREFNKYSIAGLLSLFYSAKTLDRLNIITKKELKRVLKEMDFSDEEINKFFIFLLGNENKIPFVLDDGDKIIYSKGMLFIIALKFLGALQEKPLVVELKRNIGFVFEEKIRELLDNKGYIIPFNKGFKLFKKSLEYDIVAISPTKKKIFIIEAKYHDLSSSAFSAKNLLNVKLHDKQFGEISICRRQEKRREELSKNLSRFEKKCKEVKIELYLKDFDIEALAIFKFTPILSNRGSVNLISFDRMTREL